MIVTSPVSEIPFYRIPAHKKNDYYDGNSFTLTDYDTGLPIDLTNVVNIKIQFKLTPESPVALEWSVANGKIVITDAANCEFDIVGQIITMDAGIYIADAEFTYSGGIPKTYIDFTWEILQDITT